ncbi:MAG: hypothetical protein CBC55_09080 [Gammaproteobacteria bacterium TMED95]|nr:MAG: hypothetical protein CBC55_09080 [Gammaproteobacteria bacterium TMED95]|tara:strand:- start:3657 stop:5138 length:1482 start_codon:yes stop_codon:yes gene_type:complete
MAVATLNDVTAVLQEQNEEQGKTTSAVTALVQRIQGLIDIQKRSILDEAEARRESGSGTEPPSATGGMGAAGAGFGTGFKEGLFDISGFGVLDILGVSALTAQITGFFAATAKIVKDLAKVFTKGLLLALEGTFKGISAGLRIIENAAFKLRIVPGMGAITNLLSRLTLFFEDLGIRVAKISAKIMPTLDFVKGFGKILGKLFLPLTILITAYDTVKGTIQGYQDAGIVGALEGAVTGFFNSLIAAPLDLIKNATAWVLGKLGFENAQETLNEFSFKELFSNLIGGIFDDVGKIASFVGDLFKGEFSLEKAQEALGALFSLSPVGMIMNLVEGIVPGIFEKIGNALDFFVEQLKIGSQEALLKVMNLIQNIPDQLVAFLSDNLRISIPKIAIPIPGFLGGGELVIAEPNEIGVPGGESARARVAERNARLEAQLLELNRRNLQDVQGVAAGGTTVINQNSTISNAQSTTIASDIPAAQDIYMNKGLLGGGGGF